MVKPCYKCMYMTLQGRSNLIKSGDANIVVRTRARGTTYQATTRKPLFLDPRGSWSARDYFWFIPSVRVNLMIFQNLFGSQKH